MSGITNDATARPVGFTKPAIRIRAVAADGGITLDEDRIHQYAERGWSDREVWTMVGALTETIATLVEATANGDPTIARIALEIGAERVVGWERAQDLRRLTVATPDDSSQ